MFIVEIWQKLNLIFSGDISRSPKPSFVSIFWYAISGERQVKRCGVFENVAGFGLTDGSSNLSRATNPCVKEYLSLFSLLWSVAFLFNRPKIVRSKIRSWAQTLRWKWKTWLYKKAETGFLAFDERPHCWQESERTTEVLNAYKLSWIQRT